MTFIRMEVTTPTKNVSEKEIGLSSQFCLDPKKESGQLLVVLLVFYRNFMFQVENYWIAFFVALPSKSFSVSAIHLDKRARNSINHNLQRTKK